MGRYSLSGETAVGSENRNTSRTLAGGPPAESNVRALSRSPDGSRAAAVFSLPCHRSSPCCGEPAGGFVVPFRVEEVQGVLQDPGNGVVVFGGDEDEAVDTRDGAGPGLGVFMLVVPEGGTASWTNSTPTVPCLPAGDPGMGPPAPALPGPPVASPARLFGGIRVLVLGA
jgi:hypothetical protein